MDNGQRHRALAAAVRGRNFAFRSCARLPPARDRSSSLVLTAPSSAWDASGRGRDPPDPLGQQPRTGEVGDVAGITVVSTGPGLQCRHLRFGGLRLQRFIQPVHCRRAAPGGLLRRRGVSALNTPRSPVATGWLAARAGGARWLRRFSAPRGRSDGSQAARRPLDRIVRVQEFVSSPSPPPAAPENERPCRSATSCTFTCLAAHITRQWTASPKCRSSTPSPARPIPGPPPFHLTLGRPTPSARVARQCRQSDTRSP